MFMGTALAIGPAVLLYLLVRSGDSAPATRTFTDAERVFQVSTVCYGLGILSGIAAALTGALDLTASWLVIAYVLVALLGGHGILFDRWTKRVSMRLASGDQTDQLRQDRLPGYVVLAMAALVVAIVYVMVTKPSPW